MRLATVADLPRPPADWHILAYGFSVSTRRSSLVPSMPKARRISDNDWGVDLHVWFVAYSVAGTAHPFPIPFYEISESRAATEEAVGQSAYSLMRYQLITTAVSAATCALALADFLAWVSGRTPFFHPILDLVFAISSGGLVLSVLSSQKYLRDTHGKDM